MTTLGRFVMPYNVHASSNHMYGRGKRTFLHPEARNWRRLLTDQVRQWIENHGIFIKPGHIVTISLTTHFPRERGGRGKGRKPDPSNFLKLAQDGIAAALKIDDHTFQVHAILGPEDDLGYLVYQVEL